MMDGKWERWEVGELAMSISFLKKKSEMEEKSKHVLFS
jgi:hypothetical protein